VAKTYEEIMCHTAITDVMRCWRLNRRCCRECDQSISDFMRFPGRCYRCWPSLLLLSWNVAWIASLGYAWVSWLYPSNESCDSVHGINRNHDEERFRFGSQRAASEVRKIDTASVDTAALLAQLEQASQRMSRPDTLNTDFALAKPFRCDSCHRLKLA